MLSESKRTAYSAGSSKSRAKLAALVMLFATFFISGCQRSSVVLSAEPSASLNQTIRQLQSHIANAERNGCRIKSTSLGVGHGVGVGHGLGIGVGVGIGLNIDPACPDCIDENLNKEVTRVEHDSATVTQEESIFAAIAHAECPSTSSIGFDGRSLIGVFNVQ